MAKANAEKARAKNAAWRAKNHERVRIRGRIASATYKRAHPEIVLAHNNARRAIKQKAIGSFTIAEWNAKKKLFGHRCIDCGLREGERFANGKVMKLTFGHAVPLICGGSNCIGNLIPQCGPCNSKQGRNIHSTVVA